MKTSIAFLSLVLSLSPGVVLAKFDKEVDDKINQAFKENQKVNNSELSIKGCFLVKSNNKGEVLDQYSLREVRNSFRTNKGLRVNYFGYGNGDLTIDTSKEKVSSIIERIIACN